MKFSNFVLGSRRAKTPRRPRTPGDDRHRRESDDGAFRYVEKKLPKPQNRFAIYDFQRNFSQKFNFSPPEIQNFV